MTIIKKIVNILSHYRFSFDNEKELQSHIETIFEENNINYQREYSLGDQGIIDFFIDGLGIEIKIKGQKKSIYRQCRRYTEHDDIKELLLISSNTIYLPNNLNNKNVYCYKVN